MLLSKARERDFVGNKEIGQLATSENNGLDENNR
jgi:hypothetical protein